MTLTLHNLLTRLGSPLAHAIFLGLAIAFMSLTAQAQDSAAPPHDAPYQLLVLDDPACGVCLKFKAEVGAGYDSTDHAKRATLSYVSFAQNFQIRPDLWPGWFTEMVQGERLVGGMPRGTPTFVIAETGSSGLVEVARIAGYGGVGWFNDRLTAVLDGLDAR